MNRLFMVLLGIMVIIGYTEQVLDEVSNQEALVSHRNPDIEAIIELMDQAKIDGEYELFSNLLNEYKRLNPPIVIENGPQGQVIGPEPEQGSSGPSLLWADDITVDIAKSYQVLSMDTRSDGWIFLAAARRQTQFDDYEISIWYSQDGINWTHYYSWSWTGHHCFNPSIKVVEQSLSGDYLITVFNTYETASPYDEDVWVMVHKFGIWDWNYYPISTDQHNREDNPSMDADDLQFSMNAAYLYCAFESGDSIAFMRSPDYGVTWIDRTMLAYGGDWWDNYYPSCAYGWHSIRDSFTVCVAWTVHVYEPPEYQAIRLKRCVGLGTGWLPGQLYLPPYGHSDFSPDLKMTHGTMPSGTITHRRLVWGTDIELLCNLYTYYGGRSWVNDTLYFAGEYNCLHTLAVDDAANDYHLFFKGDLDDIRYKEAHYNNLASGGWSYYEVISDGGDISDAGSPASATRNGQPCVCWIDRTNPTSNKLMFDALWLDPGIEEMPRQLPANVVSLAPNPSNGSAKFSYVVKTEGNVKISVFDAVGRLIDNLVNETKQVGEHYVNLDNQYLAAGIYIIHVETPDGVQTETMTIIR